MLDGLSQGASIAPLQTPLPSAVSRAKLCFGFSVVSFKAKLILYIKVVFLLKSVKSDSGRSEWLFPTGDWRDESLLQKAVSAPPPATAIHKLKNKSVTRVNELKMSEFEMYQEKILLAGCSWLNYCEEKQGPLVSEKNLLPSVLRGVLFG